LIGEKGQKEAVLKYLFEKVKMSFTDCTCLLLMKLYGIGKIMTFDMGFRDKELEVVS
jgi:predicted nucleic acid-binding protein